MSYRLIARMIGAGFAQAALTPLGVQAAQADCDRQCLSALTEQYLTAMVAHDPSKAPLASSENGSQTTGVPVAPGKTAGPLNFGCKEVFALGYYREDTRLRNRRIMAIDPEHGLVYAGVFFDHDAVLRTYQLTDGPHDQCQEYRALDLGHPRDIPSRQGRQDQPGRSCVVERSLRHATGLEHGHRNAQSASQARRVQGVAAAAA